MSVLLGVIIGVVLFLLLILVVKLLRILIGLVNYEGDLEDINFDREYLIEFYNAKGILVGKTSPQLLTGIIDALNHSSVCEGMPSKIKLIDPESNRFRSYNVTLALKSLECKESLNINTQILSIDGYN